MADIRILLDEQQQLTFDVEVQGVSSSRIQPRFIIETDEMDISFSGKMIDGQVTVELPILSKTLETTEYNCRLEFIVEGEKFFTPMQATLDAVLPVKVRAGINSNTVVESKTDISVSAVTINKPKITESPKKAVQKPVQPKVRSKSKPSKKEASDMKIQEIRETKEQITEAKLVKGSINLIESVITMLEDLPDIEFEPQPEFRGVGGVTKATGAGERLGRVHRQSATSDKTNTIWRKLVKQYTTMSPSGKGRMRQQLQKLAQTAQAKGIQLSPDPSQIA